MFHYSPEQGSPVERTIRKYDREFLLQFQFLPVCTEKPAGLPKHEIVLDTPHCFGNRAGVLQR